MRCTFISAIDKVSPVVIYKKVPLLKYLIDNGRAPKHINPDIHSNYKRAQHSNMCQNMMTHFQLVASVKRLVCGFPRLMCGTHVISFQCLIHKCQWCR